MANIDTNQIVANIAAANQAIVDFSRKTGAVTTYHSSDGRAAFDITLPGGFRHALTSSSGSGFSTWELRDARGRDQAYGFLGPVEQTGSLEQLIENITPKNKLAIFVESVFGFLKKHLPLWPSS